jgi:hypothetical protein
LVDLASVCLTGAARAGPTASWLKRNASSVPIVSDDVPCSSDAFVLLPAMLAERANYTICNVSRCAACIDPSPTYRAASTRKLRVAHGCRLKVSHGFADGFFMALIRSLLGLRGSHMGAHRRSHAHKERHQGQSPSFVRNI